MLVDRRRLRAQRLAALVQRAVPSARAVLRAATLDEAMAQIARGEGTRRVVAVSDELTQQAGFAVLRAALQGRDATLRVFAGADPALSDAALIAQICDAHEDGVPAVSRPAGAPVQPLAERRDMPILCLGASTGGVAALGRILAEFPADAPPTLVVQHILEGFTHGVAERLDHAVAPSVAEAHDGAPLCRGQVLLAPATGRHLEVVGRGVAQCRLTDAPPVSGHRPSVDVLFTSAARFGTRVIAAVLTGMGRDGAQGLQRIARAGGRTIAQDRASCTVYGMPRAAIELGAAQKVLPLDAIGPELLRLARQQGHDDGGGDAP